MPLREEKVMALMGAVCEVRVFMSLLGGEGVAIVVMKAREWLWTLAWSSSCHIASEVDQDDIQRRMKHWCTYIR